MEGVDAIKGAHAPAVKAGGMRVSQSHRVPLKENTNPAHLSKTQQELLKRNDGESEDSEKDSEMSGEHMKSQEAFQRQHDLNENTLPKKSYQPNDGKRKDVFQPAKGMQH